MIRDRSRVVRAMGRTGLASWTLWILVFLFEPLVLFLQPVVLTLQLLNPSPGSFAFFPRTAQLLRQFSNALDRIEGLEKPIILSSAQ